MIEGTRARYVEAYELITGASFDEWYGGECRADRVSAECAR